MKSHPSINITITTWNRLSISRLCIERLLQTNVMGAIIRIIDNGSTDGTREYLSQLKKQHSNLEVYLLPKNYGIAVASNLGWSLSNSDYYVKVDDDIHILDKNWLEYLITFLQRNDEVGMIGYRCLERHIHPPIQLPSGDLINNHYGCGGAVVCIPQKIHQRCGFWNEDYGNYGYEDLDYASRVPLSGFIAGYYPVDNIIEHKGYDPQYFKSDNEKLKVDCLADKPKGEMLFRINQFLFENNIRDLYVTRKFLPMYKGSNIYFKQNKEYLSIVQLQKDLIKKTTYTEDGKYMHINVDEFKDKRVTLKEAVDPTLTKANI